MLYFTVACEAVTFETDSTFALAVDASPWQACPLMIEENWLPFSSRAIRLAVGVLKLKKAVQLAVIALLAVRQADDDVPVVALGVAAGVEVLDVFELGAYRRCCRRRPRPPQRGCAENFQGMPMSFHTAILQLTVSHRHSTSG